MSRKGLLYRAFVLVLCMLINNVAVHADGSDTKGTGIAYTVTETYAWTVHSLVDFGDSKGANTHSTVSKENAVVVTKNVIRNGYTLKISLSDDNSFKVSTGHGNSLNYKVYNRQWTDDVIPASAVPLGVGDTVLTVPAGVNSAKSPVTFDLTTAFGTNVAEVAGDYVGVIRYKAEVVPQ